MTYLALIAGYAAAMALLLAVTARVPEAWPRREPEGGWALWRTVLLLLAVLLIGQLYQHGLLLPAPARWRLVARMVNQAIIFAPVFLAAAVIASRGSDHARRVFLMPTDRLPLRLGVGVLVAAVAFVVHQAVSGRLSALGGSAATLLHPAQLSHAVQILGEDLAIGLLLSSLLRHIRPRVAVTLTGLLFALGHIPAMLSGSAASWEFIGLIADAGLAAGVVALLLRSRDIWPIWIVHVCMDLTQFLK